MIWIIVVILLVIVLAAVGIYNSLVRSKLRVDNAWAQIDTQFNSKFSRNS